VCFCSFHEKKRNGKKKKKKEDDKEIKFVSYIEIFFWSSQWVTGMAKPRLVAAKARPHTTGGTWRNCCGHGGDSSGGVRGWLWVRSCCCCAVAVCALCSRSSGSGFLSFCVLPGTSSLLLANQLEGVLVAGVELRTGSIFFSSQNFFFLFSLATGRIRNLFAQTAPEQLHLPFEATSAALVIRSRRAVAAAAGAQGLLAEHCFFFLFPRFSQQQKARV
jgi:hypothetical protein